MKVAVVRKSKRSFPMEARTGALGISLFGILFSPSAVP